MSKSTPTTAPKSVTLLAAQTFTFRYDAREDRMMLILNYASQTARLDLMITRAMVLKLIPVIEQVMINHNITHNEPASSPQPQQGQANVSATDKDMLEVMSQTPLLLEKIDFKTLSDQGRLLLIFYASGVPLAQAVMTPEHFAQVMNVMVQSLPHHSWGIAPTILMM